MNKSRILIPLSVFLIALLCRLLFLSHLRHSPYFDNLIVDAASYDRWACSIASGNIWGDQVFYQAPLYPYFLAALYSIFGRDLVAARFVQAILGSITSVILLHLAWRLFSRRVGIVAGLLAALYSTFIFQDLMLLKAVIVFFLLSSALLRLSQGVELKRDGHLVQAGVLFGLAICGRGNLLFTVPFLLLWLLLRDGRPVGSRSVRVAVLFLLGTVLAIGPVAIRNRVVGEDWVLTESDAGINLYVGNNPRATGIHTPPLNVRTVPEHEELDAKRIAEAKLGRPLKPSEVSRYWIGRAIRFVIVKPAAEAKLIVRKLRLAWNWYEVPDNYNQYYFSRVSWLFRGFLPSFLWVSPFAVLGLFYSLPDWRRVGFLHIFVATYLLSLLTFYVTSRYRLPIVIGLIPFTSFGALRFVDLVRERAWRKISLAAALLVLVFLLGTPKLASYYGFSKQETEVATFYAQQGNFPAAEEAFGRAIEQANGSGDLHLIYLNQGRFYSSFGKYGKAEEAYQNALKANPSFTPARAELERLPLPREPSRSKP